MDLEKMMNRGYTLSVCVALGMSVLIILIGAAIGRGTLNIRGALVVDEPTDVTVIAAVEPLLEEKDIITNIKFLRKRKSEEKEKSTYDYLVDTKQSGHHFIQLGWHSEEKKWILIANDLLHGERTTDTAEEIPQPQ
jgi:hypothetical protein